MTDMERTARAAGQRTRVLLADDHGEFLSSLSRVLSASDGVQIAATAATGEQVLKLAAEHKPDIAILDVRLPGLDGIEVISMIRAAAPETAVITLSLSYDRRYVRRALESGALGYVAKIDASEQIADAVETVLRGKHFLSSSVLSELRAASMRLFSAESCGELWDLIDREGNALLRFARSIASTEDQAIEALVRSLLAYAMARDFSDELPNPRVWLVVSVAASLFGRGPSLHAFADGGKARRLGGRAGPISRLITWNRSGRGAHRDHRDFAAYWSGRMRRASRFALLHHVAWCRSCHLEWSLVGFRSQVLQRRIDRSSALEPAMLAVGKALASDIQNANAERFVIALAERGASLGQVLASEMEILFGAAAVQGWRHSERALPAHKNSPARWTSEFLGERATGFLSSGWDGVRYRR
jgi:DNA-binding NarL/FixJ family response regulator